MRSSSLLAASIALFSLGGTSTSVASTKESFHSSGTVQSGDTSKSLDVKTEASVISRRCKQCAPEHLPPMIYSPDCPDIHGNIADRLRKGRLTGYYHRQIDPDRYAICFLLAPTVLETGERTPCVLLDMVTVEDRPIEDVVAALSENHWAGIEKVYKFWMKDPRTKSLVFDQEEVFRSAKWVKSQNQDNAKDEL